jgi:hypothetical protein
LTALHLDYLAGQPKDPSSITLLLLSSEEFQIKKSTVVCPIKEFYLDTIAVT